MQSRLAGPADLDDPHIRLVTIDPAHLHLGTTFNGGFQV
jgi:hypothetical protein